MNSKVREIIADLKSYLEYLKGMGIGTLPIAETKSVVRASGPFLFRTLPQPLKKFEESWATAAGANSIEHGVPLFLERETKRRN